jgi:hypothetical protein
LVCASAISESRAGEASQSFCLLKRFDPRAPLLLLQDTHQEQRLRTEPDGVADALRSEDPGTAAIAVAQRVHCDSRLAGFGLGAN